jgi:DNA-binding SARP family transcriptional activator
MVFRFRVLGPLQIEHPERGLIAPGTPKQRLLLAVLLCHLGEFVPAERLREYLWESHPPASAEANLRSLVHQLRASLGPNAIVHDRRLGYCLGSGREQVDATDFVDRIKNGQARLAAGDAAGASHVLQEALALWRGEPFADLADEPALQVEITRLRERHASALESRIDAELALGQHAELISELTALVARFPLRERYHGQLMLALYRSGRQADALETYRRIRTTMVDELGLSPGPDLAELQQAILRNDPNLAAPPPLRDGLSKPALLPPDTRLFTGRAGHLATLDALLHEGSVGPIVISAIHGMGGVGKTALAVHWAYRVRRRFPDGQLFLNLRGYALGEPMQPVDALRRMLFALGVPPTDLPVDVDDAAGLYRSLLADKRALILLDNARDSEQVRPLLPGGHSCLVLITSRDRLGGLVAQDGARAVPLDVLDADESLALLAAALPGHWSNVDDATAREMSRLCGHLPLALRIAAANLADESRVDIADYLARLRTGDRLSRLQIEGEPRTAVRHTFDLSYLGLSASARTMLCLLALVPGDDFTVAAAAAVTGTPTALAQDQLDELTRRHLLDAGGDGRYSFHDLVRVYASERMATEYSDSQRADAYTRLLSWYGVTAAAADAVLRPSADRPQIEARLPAGCHLSIVDQADAISWYDAERDNLAAALARYGECPGLIWRIAVSMRGWLQRRADRRTWIELYEHGIAAARLDRAPDGEATLLTGLAIVWSILLQRDEAIAAYGSAIALFDRVDDLAGKVDAVASLGGFLTQMSELDEAMCHLQDAHRAVSQLADRPELRFKIEMNLGYAYRRSGDFKRAMQYYRTAAATAEHSSERPWLLASVLTNIGSLTLVGGEPHEAAEIFQTVLTLARQTGDRSREVAAFDGLADVAEFLRRPAEAYAYVASGLSIAESLGDPNVGTMRERLRRLGIESAADPAAAGSPNGLPSPVTVSG